MVLAYPPEVMAVYGKGDCQGKEPGFSQQRPGYQIPVMESFPAQNSQSNVGTEKRKESLKIDAAVNLRIAKFIQKYFYTPVIMLGRIDISHHGPVAVLELIEPHLGVNVGGAIHVVT